MAITLRARKRLILLTALVMMFSVFVSGAWFIRQWIRDSNVASAKIEGLELWQAHEYQDALPLLSLAVTYDKTNTELLIALADTRSRVFAPNGKHLTAAMRLFESVLFREPENITALQGLMRVQMDLGTPVIARLLETAKKLHELNPQDQEPIKVLKDAAVFRGRFVPPNGMQGSTADDSAVYWNDLLIQLEPESLNYRWERFILMKQGGSTSPQIVDLAEQWADEADPTDGSFDVLLAQVYQTEEMGGDAEQLVVNAFKKGISDPIALLMAIDILDNSENVEILQELREQAAARAEKELFLARATVRKPWREGQIQEARNKLIQFSDQFKIQPRDLWEGSLLLHIAGDKQLANEWAATLKSVVTDNSDLSVAQARLISKWVDFLDLVMTEDEESVESNTTATLSRLQQLEDLAANIPSREFIGIVVGDMYSQLSMWGPAAHHYSQAVDQSGSLPVTAARRLIATLLTDSRPLQALPISELLIRRYPNVLTSYLQLVRVRAALERAGLNPSQEGATIEPRLTSYELMTRIVEGQNDLITLRPLLVETALLTGQIEEAKSLISEAIDDENITESVLLDLVEVGIGNTLFSDAPELLESALTKLEDIAQTQSIIDSTLVIRSGLLRSQGMIDESNQLIVSAFAEREDDAGMQIMALEMLENAIAMDSDAVSDRIRRVLEVNISYRVLARLLSIAIQRQDVELAEEIYERISSNLGTDFPGTLFAEADLVLGFPESPNRGLSKIIADLETLADRNPNSLKIVSRQYRLLDRLDPDDLTASTQLLEEAVNAHPGALNFYPPLIDHLQRSGRYREAEEYVGRFDRYRLNASSDLKRAMAQLTAGQGNVSAALESFKEVAEADNSTISDKIQYLDLLYGSMKNEEADEYLAHLLEDPDRPVVVDLRAARRQAQLNGLQSGLDLLEKSDGFKSDSDLRVAKANLMALYQQWELCLEELGYGTGSWNNSFDSNYLAAKSLRSLGRLDEASIQFKEAVGFAEDREEMLIVLANEQMPHPELRGNVRGILDLISDSTVRPERIEVMTLALDAAGPDTNFAPDANQLDRALELTRRYPGSVDAWNLAVQLHGVAESGEVFEDVIETAISRFAANANFPRTYARYLLSKGDYEKALSFANLADERSPGTRVIDTVLRGQALTSLGQYGAVATMMGRTKPEIIAENKNANPSSNWSIAYQMYLASLMKTNRVDDAWLIFKDVGPKPPVGYDWWRRNAVSLPYGAGRIALDLLAKEDFDDELRARIAMALSWTTLAQRTRNEKARDMATEQLESLRDSGQNLLDPFQQFRIEIAYAGIQELESSIDAMESYRVARNRIPDGVEEAIMNAVMSNQPIPRELRGFANMMVMALNNQAALSARLGIDLDLALESVNQALALVPGNPELLDTRALVLLASNEPRKAMQDAMAAAEMIPDRIGFKMTLVKTLIASNELAEAESILDEIDQLSLLQPEPDLAVREEVSDLRSLIAQRIAG